MAAEPGGFIETERKFEAGAGFTLYTAAGRFPGTSTGIMCTTAKVNAIGSCVLAPITPGVYFVVQTTTPGDFLAVRPRRVVTRAGHISLLNVHQVETTRKAGLLISLVDQRGSPVLGATFTLYTVMNRAPGVPTGESCTTALSPITNQGQCQMKFVATGAYFVVETHSPAGYSTAKSRSRHLAIGHGYLLRFRALAGG